MLFMCSRLIIGRNVIPQLCHFKKFPLLSLIRPIKIKAVPYKCTPEETYDEYNMRIGRPQSPHLSIYAPQFQSLTSFFHRATGLMLSGYFVLFGVSALVLPDQISHYIEVLQVQHIGSVPITILRLILVLPFCYHWMNGIRHLIWDMGYFLGTMPVIYKTGYVMLFCAFGLSITAALI